jgi:hypothetical protein
VNASLIAGAASFAVYLLPLITVHWISPFGDALARELGSDRAVAWKLSDIALALGLQLLLFVLVRLALARNRALAALVFAAALVPATLAVNAAYLIAIPTMFLIEEDPAEDLETLKEACSTTGYTLAAAPAGLSRELEQRGEAVLMADDGRGVAILGTDCNVEPVAALPANALAIHQVLPDGTIVFPELSRTDGRSRFWLARRRATTAVPVSPPDGVQSELPPLVADEGTSAAWLVRDAPGRLSIAIAPVDGGAPVRFSHGLLSGTTSTLVSLNMTRRELVIVRDLDVFAGLSLDGTVLWGPATLGDVAAQPGTARRMGENWLSWDATREDGPYRLEWSTAAGRGRHTVPRGRHITAAALHPEGRYLAASTTTALNIGSIQDAVFVLDARDGSLVWRKTLPTYARSRVAFLGRGRFAFADLEETGIKERPLRGRVRVLRLP